MEVQLLQEPACCLIQQSTCCFSLQYMTILHCDILVMALMKLVASLLIMGVAVGLNNSFEERTARLSKLLCP